MKKPVQYFAIWIYSFLCWPLNRRLNKKLKGGYITGQALIDFIDPNVPNKTFGVVVFVLPPGTSLDKDFFKNLYGPFGFTMQVDLFGKHLYGLDTWGEPNQQMVEENLDIFVLDQKNPDSRIQLAGVRRLVGRHLWPLNNPSWFRLYYKEVEMPSGTLMYEFFGNDVKSAIIHTFAMFFLWAILTKAVARLTVRLSKFISCAAIVVSAFFAMAHVVQWFFIPVEKTVNGKWKVLPVITVFSSLMALMIEWLRESVAHTYRKKSKGE